MKHLASILLLIIAFGMVFPAGLVLPVPAQEEALISLNVCGSAAPALSGGGEMPVIAAAIGVPAPCIESASHADAVPVLTDILLASRNEQPPRS